MILAGDVGGTKTSLGLFQVGSRGVESRGEAVYQSRNYPDLAHLIRRFCSDQGFPPRRLAAAAFGVAGPVEGEKVAATNLPWNISRAALKRELQLKEVYLLNDLEATGYALPLLEEKDLEVLNQGRKRPGHACLIAAGTGLGESILFWDGEQFIPMPSEGGHADFAPRNDLEIELLRFLQKRFPHVSYERLVSGPGLWNIYQFVRGRANLQEPAWLLERLEKEDPSAVVSQVGMEGSFEPCRQALRLFVSLYGAEAGNLALKCKAQGGVFVGGGIAPKILPALREGTFLEGFLQKGRFRKMLSTFPVKVILQPKAALWGAARYAALCGQTSLKK